MRYLLIIGVLSIGLLGCKEESYLRLRASEEMKDLIPDFSQSPSFRTSSDTIHLHTISDVSYFEEVSADLDAGSIGSFEKMELERRELIVGSDTPYFRIHFNLATYYEESSITKSRDELTISLNEEGQANTANLSLSYLEDLSCLSANCAFSDSLVIDSTLYLNVYYLAADSAMPAIFVNKSEGLAAFKTTENITYQRIK